MNFSKQALLIALAVALSGPLLAPLLLVLSWPDIG